MIEKTIVTGIVGEFLENSSLFLVDVEIKQGNIIVVEVDSEKTVSIDDCVALSRYIESKLDRETEDYELEVGSAGIGQAFKTLRQYLKNVGNEVEVLTKSGQKLTGILKAADKDSFVLTIEKQVKPEGAKRKVKVEEDLTFRYDEIKKTNYLIRFK
jgi:ribosome maturation factor RimP